MYFCQRIDEAIEAMPAHLYLRRYQGFSSLLCKRLRLQGRALCNGRPLRMIDPVRQGDLLDLHYPEEGEPPQDWRCPERGDCRVVYQDAQYILIDKPAGWLSHPNFVGPTGPSVTDYFLPYQLHPVSRLDRGTEGLMLLARSGYAHYRLQREGQAHKRYRAFVLGAVGAAGSWTWPIDRKPGSCVERCYSPTGKAARTDYSAITRYGSGASLLELELHSGRTHQIRLHGHLAGHALVGESLYPAESGFWTELAARCGAQARNRLQEISENYGHQALQAAELSFYQPFLRRRLNFTLPLSPKLQQLASDLCDWARLYGT